MTEYFSCMLGYSQYSYVLHLKKNSMMSWINNYMQKRKITYNVKLFKIKIIIIIIILLPQ